MNDYFDEDIKKATDSLISLRRYIINKVKLPIVQVRLVAPNYKKSSLICNKIIGEINDVISGIYEYKIKLKIKSQNLLTPYAIFAIDETKDNLKKTAINIEDNHILGGCISIGVYDINNIVCKRQSLQYKMRKCILCDDSMENCVNLKRHSSSEINHYILDKYNQHKNSFSRKI